jgi:hypothetical protein
MKTLKIGDWLRHIPLGLTSILCQVSNSKIQLICFKDENKLCPPNRWSSNIICVDNIYSITMDEIQQIVGNDYQLNEFEVKIEKRYINLMKYLKSN